MKRLSLILVWLLICTSTAFAQRSRDVDYDDFILHTARATTHDGTSVSVDYSNTVAFDVLISGTSATVLFRVAGAGKLGWQDLACTASDSTVPSTTATASGLYTCNVAGADTVSARVDACTSCSVSVVARRTSAVLGGGGSGSGAAQGLEANFLVENTIISATSANTVEITNGTQGIAIYGDATDGGVIKPIPLGDSLWRIWTNFNGCIRDMEAGANMLCFDPDASSKKLMYPFQTGYYPLKSFYVSAQSIIGDGTNCPTSPTLVTISNSSRYSHICTENNSSRRKFVVPMRPNWDGGVIYIKPYYSQTAADTGSVLLDVAAACRALGTAFNGTYGTEVNVDDAVLVGSGAIEGTLSGAITPNGSCSPSDELFVYMDVDATTNPTTAAATLNFLGVDVFYSETSMSH